MKRKIIKTVILILELILIGTFVYTGLEKLLHFENWYDKFIQINLINNFKLAWLAYIIPVGEIAIGALFCVKRSKKIASIFSLSLMVIFTIYIYYKIYISEDSLCPCGGIFSQLTLDKHLWVNIFLVIISILLLLNYIFLYKNESNGSN